MSDEINVPKELETLPERPTDNAKVPVSLTSDHEFNPQQIDELCKHLGHVHVTGQRLKALHSLGVSGEQLGILRTLKGGVIVSADSLVQAIGRIETALENPDLKHKEVVEYSKTLAFLTNAYIRLSTGAVKMDRDVAEVVIEQDKQRRNTFAPGRRITGMPQAGHPPIPV